jgi:hypothetical protein
MRNSLSRIQFSAFGAAFTLLAVMFAINRGRPPAAASAAEERPVDHARTIVNPTTTQPTVVTHSSH